MDNPVTDERGIKSWVGVSGKYHRDDGPAVEWPNGYKAWYQHGLRHRDGGPAVEFASGDKEWWQHGSVHRDDGPALEISDGTKAWWLNDQEMSFDEYLNKVDMSDEAKVMMKLKYG